MPDLVKGASPRSFSFAVSLPHSLLATASLVCAAPHFEGLGDWPREARVLMPRDLLTELCVLVTFPGRYQRFTAELLAKLPADVERMAFEQMLEHLESVSGDEYQQMALRALSKASSPTTPASELLILLEKPASWAEFLAHIESHNDPAIIASLVRDGERLKQRVLEALSQFWHECYHQEFSATVPLMERSVAYHRAQGHGPRFEDLFLAVTGRLVPGIIAEEIGSAASVLFIPSCYVGPYVAYTQHDDRLIIYYNCRSTPASAQDTGAAGRASLYPPLKALADETRLEILALLSGGERYAQEIVDRLGLSQPAVSRHLNLMATAGILEIRREGSSKYYRINSGALAQVADALRTFL